MHASYHHLSRSLSVINSVPMIIVAAVVVLLLLKIDPSAGLDDGTQTRPQKKGASDGIKNKDAVGIITASDLIQEFGKDFLKLSTADQMTMFRERASTLHGVVKPLPSIKKRKETKMCQNNRKNEDCNLISQVKATNYDIERNVQLFRSSGKLSCLDTSKVTNMDRLFLFEEDFNAGISCWNVSSVTSMNSMFLGAYRFNRDISSWDVSSVTDMNDMFVQTSDFDCDLSSWDVSSVVKMSSMFYLSTTFNGDVSNWDVSSVTTMNSMFRDTIRFNTDLSSWDVSKVIDTSSMFAETHRFKSDISSWNVSSVKNMESMFWMARVFNVTLCCCWSIPALSDDMYYSSDTYINCTNLIENVAMVKL